MPLIFPRLDQSRSRAISQILNNYCFNHEVYDLLVIVDANGRIISTNTLDSNRSRFLPATLNRILGTSIRDYPQEYGIFRDSMRGYSSRCDWYQSSLVHRLYDYRKEDRSHHYNMALSEPIRDPRTSEIVGVWINIINWFYIQNILDNVEMDLAGTDLKTGYAFMLARDADTMIGHKYRKNRASEDGLPARADRDLNLYGSRIVKDHGLRTLREAILGAQSAVLPTTSRREQPRSPALRRSTTPPSAGLSASASTAADIFQADLLRELVARGRHARAVRAGRGCSRTSLPKGSPFR